MIACTIRLLLSETDRSHVITLLSPMIGWTRVQPGCHACYLLTEPENPRVLVLWEEWDTQDELDRHLRSEDFRRVLAAIELSQGAAEIRFDTVEALGRFEVMEAAQAPRT